MPIRRNPEMHRGRISLGSSIYFVTCCLKSRRGSHLDAIALIQLTEHIRTMDLAGDTRTFAFVGMPDHIHWLFEMGERLALRQVVAKLKFLSRHRMSASKATWQRDYYAHRVRANESVEDYALYIFLNPYRAGLLQPGGAIWPYWWTARTEDLEFLKMLNAQGSPPREWLGRAIPAGVRDGD